MEFLILLLLFFVYIGYKVYTTPYEKLEELNKIFEEFNARNQQPNDRTQAPKTPQPTVAPSTQHDWRQPEADNEKVRENDVLKSRGDGYELHIGRMFERKGDLVIYNGMIRGYKDQGVDLIVISKNDQSVHLVQCKHWKKYEFTEQHLISIYRKLSSYYRDYADLQPEAIKHYLAIYFSDDDIRQRIKESQSYTLRKTLYLASDKVMTVDVHTKLTPLRENIYRYQDMKVVVSGMG